MAIEAVNSNNAFTYVSCSDRAVFGEMKATYSRLGSDRGLTRTFSPEVLSIVDLAYVHRSDCRQISFQF